MRRFLMCAALIGVGIAVMSCQSATQPVAPAIESRIIEKAEFPQQLDTSRTYVYTSGSVNADSLIEEMVKADLPLSRAWLPLDNMCMDPVGPRFTVELTQPDQEIGTFGFVKGVGRLACATKAKLYIFTR